MIRSQVEAVIRNLSSIPVIRRYRNFALLLRLFRVNERYGDVTPVIPLKKLTKVRSSHAWLG
jgi:hypothetical protein